MNDRSLIFLVVGVGVLGWLILQSRKNVVVTAAPANPNANPSGGNQSVASQDTFSQLLALGKSVVDAFTNGSKAETNTQRI